MSSAATPATPGPWLRTVYAAEVTRYHVAVKYFALKALRGAERAIEACEPEDQAHYGRLDCDDPESRDSERVSDIFGTLLPVLFASSRHHLSSPTPVESQSVCLYPPQLSIQGIGARSARMSLLLVMAILFCSLSPLILGCFCGLSAIGLTPRV